MAEYERELFPSICGLEGWWKGKFVDCVVKKKVLILGITGMLGHALFRCLSRRDGLDVYGTVRKDDNRSWFPAEQAGKIISGVEAERMDTVAKAAVETGAEVIINCIGLIKQSPLADDPVAAITLNALLPHQVALICCEARARLIHVSTDCVFDGTKGMYREDDISNADDLYGRTKYLGEIRDKPHCITIRTSIIGHELKGKRGLIEWFLAQEGSIRGFTGAIYSGFPTAEFSRIVADYIIPRPELSGLYHISSEPISKYDLLWLVAKRYGKNIDIEPYGEVRQDRSLDSLQFRKATGYTPPSWSELVDVMYRDFVESYN